MTKAAKKETRAQVKSRLRVSEVGRQLRRMKHFIKSLEAFQGEFDGQVLVTFYQVLLTHFSKHVPNKVVEHYLKDAEKTAKSTARILKSLEPVSGFKPKGGD